MKPLDVLMPAKGMDLIEDEISARLPLHRLWLEPNPRPLACGMGAANPRDRDDWGARAAR